MVKNESQKGFIAITVAATIIIILALLTVGFTRIVQREQRQTLDRQLSRQALYAAESGINDVYSKLQADTTLPTKKNTCDAEDASNLDLTPDLDLANQVKYTCVLYDKSPGELEYSSIPETESKILDLTNAREENLPDITFEWGEASGSNSISDSNCDSGNFQDSRSSEVPLLRLDLTKTNSLSRTNLIGNTDYLYLTPCSVAADGVDTLDFDAAGTKDGLIVPIKCDAGGDYPCRLTITNLNSRSFMARIRPVYSTAKLKLSSSNAEFLGQFSIDVTAKANDIVRRLRATIPAKEIVEPPESVIQAFDGVCKRLTVTSASITDDCVY